MGDDEREVEEAREQMSELEEGDPPEKLEDWHRRHQEEMSMLVWSQPSIEHSYFKNSNGEIHTVMPFRVVDYWEWTREMDPADYTFS